MDLSYEALELNLGGVLCTFLGFEVGFGVEAVDVAEDVAGELAQVGVVAACYLIEVVALLPGSIITQGFVSETSLMTLRNSLPFLRDSK